ncbi:hypothetical protein GGI10_005554, partial [Coemansia sp. RSA 2530]
MSPATATPAPSAPETSATAYAAAVAKHPQQPPTPTADAASITPPNNTTQHAAVPPTRAWKVPEQLTLNKSLSSAADPISWPDPATAASETAQPQTPSTATMPGKKGKGKWTPLEAEIQYPKPKNAIQSPTTPRQPKSQYQNGAASNGAKQSTGPSTKDGSDTSSVKGAKSASSSGKGKPRSDVPHDQQSRQTTAKEAAPVSNSGSNA